jgi:hypothetical protein
LATAVAAALTKESLLLVLVGYALWRRDRRGVLLAGIPIAAAASWWGILRLTLDSTARQVHEFDPIHGLWVAARDWVHGDDLGAACVFLLAIVLGIVALRRGALRRPFGWAIALQLGFVATLGANVLATGSNGYRALLPLLALSVLDMTSRPTNVSSPRAALASTR